jgi:hypothetical protein
MSRASACGVVSSHGSSSIGSHHFRRLSQQ